MRYLARAVPSGKYLRSKGRMVHSIRGFVDKRVGNSLTGKNCVIPLTRAIPERIRGAWLRRCAIQIDVYFTYFTLLTDTKPQQNTALTERRSVIAMQMMLMWMPMVYGETANDGGDVMWSSAGDTDSGLQRPFESTDRHCDEPRLKRTATSERSVRDRRKSS